jgi:DNA-binding CsgD family transcriptional regulator
MIKPAETRSSIPQIQTPNLPHPHISLLIRTFDAFGLCFAFVDMTGRLQHVNRARLEHLALSPESEAIRSELVDFGSCAVGLAKRARLGATPERLAERTINRAEGDYTFEGIYVAGDASGYGAMIIISVRVPPPDPFCAAFLKERYNLTRKQAGVARLVAQGLRNDEIARRLFISQHTARHHVEQIKLKLGAHTRAAVAARIMGGAPCERS